WWRTAFEAAIVNCLLLRRTTSPLRLFELRKSATSRVPVDPMQSSAVNRRPSCPNGAALVQKGHKIIGRILTDLVPGSLRRHCDVLLGPVLSTERIGIEKEERLSQPAS